MSHYIWSKKDPDVLLHIVNRLSDISHQRKDIVPDKEYLQVGVFKMDEGKTFRPHQHIPLQRQTDITQESWLVFRGRVKAQLYDTDKTLLEEVVLEPGDCSITLRGGHNYVSLDDDTVVYEYKTGPYMGQAKDKVFIDE